MRIKTTPVKGKELNPGDLFSTADQDYWDHYDPLSVGQKVYIRTNFPLHKKDQEEVLYRITIETD